MYWKCGKIRVLAFALVCWPHVSCADEALLPTEGVGLKATSGSKTFEHAIEFQYNQPSSLDLITLGELPADGVLRGVIHCENRSDQAIDLSRAVTTCGCMVVTGAVVAPLQTGDLTFALRSSNAASRQGEVSVFIPVAEEVVRTLQCTWTRAPTRVLLAEQTEDASVDGSVSENVSIDVYGLTPPGATNELAAPNPTLKLRCADGAWRSVPAAWNASTSLPSELDTSLALWSGRFLVLRSNLIDPAAPLMVDGAEPTKVQVRIDAQGWSSSQRLELRLTETNSFSSRIASPN